MWRNIVQIVRGRLMLTIIIKLTITITMTTTTTTIVYCDLLIKTNNTIFDLFDWCQQRHNAYIYISERFVIEFID